MNRQGKLLRLLLCVAALPAGLMADKSFIRFPSLFEDRLASHEEQVADTWRVLATYEQSTQARALGGYFGPKGQSDFWLGTANVDPDEAVAVNQRSDIPQSNLVLLGNSQSIGVQLRPQRMMRSLLLERSVVSARHGLRFQLGVNLQEVRQTLRPAFRALTREGSQQLPAIRDYLMGSYSNPIGEIDDPYEAQEDLRHLRFYDGWKSRAGVDSIALTLTKDFQVSVGAPFHFGLWAEALLPAHRTYGYSYLFQPDYKQQTALGRLGGSAMYEGQFAKNVAWELVLSGEMGYSLPFNQERTFGVRGKTWSFYQLMGFKNMVTAQDKAIPSANLLTVPSRVNQGFCGTFAAQGLLRINERVVCSLAYTLYGQDEERVRPRGNPFADQRSAFLNAEQARAATVTNVLQVGVDSFFAPVGPDTFLQPSDLDLASAATPGFVSQSIQLAVGSYLDGKATKAFGWLAGASYHYANVAHEQDHVRVFIDLNVSY